MYGFCLCSVGVWHIFIISSFQFDAYLKVLRDMIKRVETEQRGKLQQLHSIKQEQK